MACKASSFLVLLLISTAFVATTWETVAARHIAPKNSNTQDKKQPQWFTGSDGFYIPGIGRVGLPPFFGFTPQNPYTGGSGVGSGPTTGHSYVPGGDDTFVPNPGFEVPNPGSGGGVPATVHP